MDGKPERNRKGLPLDDKRLKFQKKTGTCYTHDEGLAREIDQRFGQRGQEEFARAFVNEVPQSMTKVNEGTRHNHNYFFAVPDLPWKRGLDATEKGKVKEDNKQEHQRVDALREAAEAVNSNCNVESG